MIKRFIALYLSKENLPVATHSRQIDSSSPISQQLPIALWANSHPHAIILTSLISFRSCTSNHICCEYGSAMDMLCSEDSISKHSFPSFVLIFFPPLLPWCSLRLGGEVGIDVPFSLNLFFVLQVLESLHWLLTAYHRKKLILSRLTAAHIHWYKHKYLEGSLTTLPFSKITIVLPSPFLGPIISSL